MKKQEAKKLMTKFIHKQREERYKLEARENWDAAKYENGIKYLSTL